MPNGKAGGDSENWNRIVEEVRRERKQRENTYREKALRMFPHICAHCGREFSGKKLRELTVHHKDHNHENNPPDGSNWELLCIYCHDNEHSRDSVAEFYDQDSPRDISESKPLDSPFASLDKLLKGKL